MIALRQLHGGEKKVMRALGSRGGALWMRMKAAQKLADFEAGVSLPACVLSVKERPLSRKTPQGIPLPIAFCSSGLGSNSITEYMP